MASPTEKSSLWNKDLHALPLSTIQQVDTILEELPKIEDISAKKEQLEKAFSLLRASHPTKDVAKALYTTILVYAEKARYNQDGEQGMKDTRALLQWSIESQLSGSVKEIFAYESLQKLSAASPAVDPTAHAATIPYHTAKEKALFTNSLRLLSYACQNIDALAHPDKLSFHKELYTLTLELLGDNTEEVAEFRYNKDAFLVELEGKDEEEQAKTYDPVLELFAKAWGTEDERYKGKVAQVRNMQAIMTFRQKNEGWHQKALAYSREAVSIREAMQEPQEPEKQYTHGYLLANARQVLARILADGSQAELAEAKAIIAKSIAFAAEWRAKGKNDSYFEGYDKVLQYTASK